MRDHTAGHALTKKGKKKPNKQLNHSNLPLPVEVLECVRYLRGCELRAAAVGACVYRLVVMFTVSNELMSLVEGFSEAATFHCLTASGGV